MCIRWLINWSALLTSWCRVVLEKLTGLQLVKKFPAFHGTRRFITAFTSVRHPSLSWASPIQSIYPHPTSWRSILILSTHLRLGLPSGLYTSGFPTKNLYTPLSSSIRATCPAHLKIIGFRNVILRKFLRTHKYWEPLQEIWSLCRFGALDFCTLVINMPTYVHDVFFVS